MEKRDRQLTRGKPRKLTAVAKFRFCQSLRLGAPQYIAAQYAGISTNTVHRWLHLGEEDRRRGEDTIYARFSEDVEQAIGFVVHKNLQKIDRHADHSWQASAWLLERVAPDHFGKQSRVKIEDWRSQVVELIAQNLLSIKDVVDEFGIETARELFAQAGTPFNAARALAAESGGQPSEEARRSRIVDSE